MLNTVFQQNKTLSKMRSAYSAIFNSQPPRSVTHVTSRCTSRVVTLLLRDVRVKEGGVNLEPPPDMGALMGCLVLRCDFR